MKSLNATGMVAILALLGASNGADIAQDDSVLADSE